MCAFCHHRNVQIVRPEWVLDCIKSGRKLDCKPYLPQGAPEAVKIPSLASYLAAQSQLTSADKEMEKPPENNDDQTEKETQLNNTEDEEITTIDENPATIDSSRTAVSDNTTLKLPDCTASEEKPILDHQRAENYQTDRFDKPLNDEEYNNISKDTLENMKKGDVSAKDHQARATAEMESLAETICDARGEHKVRSAADENFIGDYFKSSRLHHLSVWRSQFEDQLKSNLLMTVQPLRERPESNQEKQECNSEYLRKDTEENDSLNCSDQQLLDNEEREFLGTGHTTGRIVLHVDMVSLVVRVSDLQFVFVNLFSPFTGLLFCICGYSPESSVKELPCCSLSFKLSSWHKLSSVCLL